MSDDKEFSIPMLSSSLFTYELWGANNSILLDNTRLKASAIGYCSGNELAVRPKNNNYAVMIEEQEQEQFNICGHEVTTGEWVKYWIHIPDWRMKELFGVDDD